jgi:hypothetical protein
MSVALGTLWAGRLHAFRCTNVSNRSLLLPGMRGAEPLSPATLAYFATAAAQPRPLPASPHAASGPAGADGSCSTSEPVLRAGLPAADMLSPFQSGAPSPLALLQALQADADLSDSAAGASRSF